MTLDFFGCPVKASELSQHLAAMELLSAQVKALQSELAGLFTLHSAPSATQCCLFLCGHCSPAGLPASWLLHCAHQGTARLGEPAFCNPGSSPASFAAAVALPTLPGRGQDPCVSFRLEAAAVPPAAKWGKALGWTPRDDAALLVGVYFHGLGHM